jgi:hypothetical protein
MSTIPAKQIVKILSAPVRVAAFSANGGSSTVTTAITTALSTAGNAGVSAPVQVSSSNGLGIITTAPSNRVEIYDATTKDKIASTAGDEVFARLTEVSGVYTLTYYTLPTAGTETAYSFGTSTPIDFEFGYRFDFDRFPVDGIIATSTRNVSQDPAVSGGRIFRERLSPSAQNTIPAVSKTPVDTATFALFVNGVHYDTFGSGAAVVGINTTTKAVSWSAANAGFNVETNDRVVAQYLTYE